MIGKANEWKRRSAAAAHLHRRRAAWQLHPCGGAPQPVAAESQPAHPPARAGPSRPPARSQHPRGRLDANQRGVPAHGRAPDRRFPGGGGVGRRSGGAAAWPGRRRGASFGCGCAASAGDRTVARAPPRHRRVIARRCGRAHPHARAKRRGRFRARRDRRCGRRYSRRAADRRRVDRGAAGRTPAGGRDENKLARARQVSLRRDVAR